MWALWGLVGYSDGLVSILAVLGGEEQALICTTCQLVAHFKLPTESHSAQRWRWAQNPA